MLSIESTNSLHLHLHTVYDAAKAIAVLQKTAEIIKEYFMFLRYIDYVYGISEEKWKLCCQQNGSYAKKKCKAMSKVFPHFESTNSVVEILKLHLKHCHNQFI